MHFVELFKKAGMASVLAVVLMFSPSFTARAAQQGPKTVTVSVADDIGPVIGASVVEKGTTNGGVTDTEGKMVLKVSEGQTITVSCIGYVTVEVTVGKSDHYSVLLKEDAEMIEETVVVGYGVQKKESLTSAISQIGAEDIANTKQIDVVSSLQGKVPGLLITQSNSRPGDFNSSLSLRGYGNPMIVVDGVVRSGGKAYRNFWVGTQEVDDMSVLQELDPNDIESISVLKDASAAIYGLGASNGVILITTKKGKVQKPSVSFSANVGLQQPTTVRQKIDWVDFMKWDNGMRDVSRLNHRWTDEMIKGYENGDPNYVYYDWYGNLTKKVSMQQQYNVSVRGGSEQVQYYFGLGYADDDTIFKTDAYNYNRYNFNGNITAKITDNIEARFQTSMRLSNTMQPGSYNDMGSLTYYIYMISPTIEPWVKSGSGHLSSVPEHKNPVAILDPQYELTDRKSNAFNNTLDITYSAPWLKGLKLQATGAYDYDMSLSRVKLHQWEEYDYETDKWSGYGCGNGNNFKQQDQYYEDWMSSSRLYGRFQANYSKQIKGHDIQAMLAAEATINKRSTIFGFRPYGESMEDSFYTHDTIDQGYEGGQTNKGNRSSSATAGYLSRVNYNYQGKYFAEVMGRYDGTYVYAPGKRWGFFPSYSLGWRISEESFIKNNAPWINNLKLRWSDGFTGSVQGSAYQYLLGYTTSSGLSYSFTEGSSTSGYANNSTAETILSWSHVRMMDAGFDWELWKGKFGGSFDWFRRTTSGIAARRTATLPDFYGVSLPQENLNKSENMGLELMLYHRNNIGQFNYRVQATATYTRSRMLYQESDKTATYSSSYNHWSSYNTGRWNGYNSGTMYHTNGQYSNLHQIADANIMYDRVNGNRDVTPGQYEVVDRNGNGYIDGQDVFYVFSSSNPPLQYGLQISGNYKRFDFSMVFNGTALRWNQVSMSGYAGTGFFYYMPKQYTDSYHVANYGDDPWDPNTQWIAGYYPALQAATQVNNASMGTYGMALPYSYINAAFLRLKTLDLGYTVSPQFLTKAGIKSCRLSLNTTNLFTFCDKRLKYTDPETQDNGENGGTLPPNRAYTFGIRLNF